ncbi:MAG: hypothetical protein V7K92_10655 [Nostoc sp.]|uniref:hypothetical protein n=1 Tax=Nostoc sp. TaxID=1180 RepID=UPI002FF26DD0
MRRRSPPQASRCASCVSPGSDRGGISSPTNANHIGYLQVALVKHRNELKLGNLASGDKIAQKALNRFSLAVWGIRQRYPYPGSN